MIWDWPTNINDGCVDCSVLYQNVARNRFYPNLSCFSFISLLFSFGAYCIRVCMFQRQAFWFWYEIKTFIYSMWMDEKKCVWTFNSKKGLWRRYDDTLCWTYNPPTKKRNCSTPYGWSQSSNTIAMWLTRLFQTK